MQKLINTSHGVLKLTYPNKNVVAGAKFVHKNVVGLQLFAHKNVAEVQKFLNKIVVGWHNILIYNMI